MTTKNTTVTKTNTSKKVPTLAIAPKGKKADKASKPVVDAGAQAVVPATATQVQQGSPVVAPTNPLHVQILSVLGDSSIKTSREVVLALGRKCGQKEGQPVVNYLNRLVSQGLVKEVANGNAAMYSWQLTETGLAEAAK
jgi:hypothetical protein